MSESEMHADLVARHLDIQNRALEAQFDARYAELDDAARTIVDTELDRLGRILGSRGLTKWQAALTAKDPVSPLHPYIWPELDEREEKPERDADARKLGRPADDAGVRADKVRGKIRTLRDAGRRGPLSVRDVAAAEPDPISERQMYEWAEKPMVRAALEERLKD